MQVMSQSRSCLKEEPENLWHKATLSSFVKILAIERWLPLPITVAGAWGFVIPPNSRQLSIHPICCGYQSARVYHIWRRENCAELFR